MMIFGQGSTEVYEPMKNKTGEVSAIDIMIDTGAVTSVGHNSVGKRVPT